MHACSICPLPSQPHTLLVISNSSCGLCVHVCVILLHTFQFLHLWKYNVSPLPSPLPSSLLSLPSPLLSPLPSPLLSPPLSYSLPSLHSAWPEAGMWWRLRIRQSPWPMRSMPPSWWGQNKVRHMPAVHRAEPWERSQERFVLQSLSCIRSWHVYHPFLRNCYSSQSSFAAIIWAYTTSSLTVTAARCDLNVSVIPRVR